MAHCSAQEARVEQRAESGAQTPGKLNEALFKGGPKRLDCHAMLCYEDGSNRISVVETTCKLAPTASICRFTEMTFWTGKGRRTMFAAEVTRPIGTP